MCYNDSKRKGYEKWSANNKSKDSSQFSSLPEEKNEAWTKEELHKIKKSINDVRHKMYEVASFDEGKSIITDETVRVSQELDVLITEYYRKKYKTKIL